MSEHAQRYCLDANVLINAWNHYYSKDLCRDYWDELRRLGHEGRVFLAEAVKDEIIRTDDELSDWLKGSGISIYVDDGAVTEIVNAIFLADPRHSYLIDNTKSRSLADPWVIAHAIAQKACVVTKENKVTTSDKKIKIPNVCQAMGVRCINDFDMLRELRVQFSCSRSPL